MKTPNQHISMILLICHLVCSATFSYGQAGCSSGNALIYLYTGYGKDYSVNNATYVGNGQNAVGIADGVYATVKHHATPANRGVITLDLTDNIPHLDTIRFVGSSKDNNLCTWDVSVSADGTNFSAVTSYSFSSSTLSTFTYIVNHAAGARYIRFTSTSSTKEFRLDAVSYNKKTCKSYCSSNDITYISGNATANPSGSTASNPNRALGAIDPQGNSFAKIDGATGQVLYLDLGTTVPYGTYIQLFLADDAAGTHAMFEVTTSDNHITYSGAQTFTATNVQLNFTDFYYYVTASAGIRYLKIRVTNAVKGDVDAVRYQYPAYWGYNYITGYVFSDANTNTVKDASETGSSNITVLLTKDYNNNGAFDAGDITLQSATTTSGGYYQFQLGTIDSNYLVSIVPSTLPANNSLTTSNVQSAHFSNLNNTDCDNNFGYYICTGNCKPVAYDDYAVAIVGTATYVNVLYNDYDANNNINTSSLQVIVQPRKGSVAINNGVLIYTPIATGYDTLTYRIADLSSPTPLWDTAILVMSNLSFSIDVCDDAAVSHLYYIPGPEEDLRTVFDRADCNTMGSLSDSMRTIISIKCPYPGIVIYYDHWEDGYETTLLSPTQSTTYVWGDGNPYNGIAPGYANDIIPAGGSIILDNVMFDNPRNSSQIYYDGKDKLFSTADLALSRISWDQVRTTLQAYSVDVYDLTRFGTSFNVPVGNYTGATKDFQYTALFIRAAYDNTSVSIDLDNDGTIDATTTLSEGQSYFQNGGVMAGALVTSSLPVGVDVFFGDSTNCWNAKELNILPAQYYGSTYYTPVPTTKSPDSAVVMFYNPMSQQITINWSTSVSSGSFNIGAKGVYRFPLGANGYKFQSAGGESYVANELIDAWTMDGTTSNGADYDWAFALIPETRLTSFGSVAWAPGSSNGTANGNPVFVMPTANTTIYVKWDGNVTGSTGSTSPCGLKYDSSYVLSALQVKKLLDNSDNDQSGLAVYNCSGVKMAMAYGEDPSLSGIATPYIDVGTSIQPFCSDKNLFANDDFAYTLINTPVTISVLTNDTGFLATIDRSSLSTTGSLQPSHGTITTNSNGTLLYIPNSGYTGFDTLMYQVCSTAPAVCDEAYVIIKISACPSPGNKNIITGQAFLDISKDGINNDGGTGVSGVKIWLYVDGNCNSSIDVNELIDSAIVDASGYYQFIEEAEKTIADNFQDANGNRTCANGTDGTVSWTSDWTDAGDATSGFCQSGGQNNIDADIIKDALGVGLRLKDNNVSVTRSANLSGASAAYLSFSYRRKSATFTTGEADSVQVSSNGTTFTTIFTVSGTGVADAGYIAVNNINILPYASANFAIRIKTNNNVDDADTVYFDNITIRYLKYSQCFITKIDTTTMPANYYRTTANQHAFSANSGATCFSNYDFGIAKNSVTISGTLYNDVNGLSDNLVNGTAFDNPSGTTLYAYLVASNGKVVFKDTLNNGNGTYSFNKADVQTSYTVIITSTNTSVGSDAPPVVLPWKWTSTGENFGSNNTAGSGNETGTPNTMIAVTTGVVNVTGVNFGIQMPNAGADKATCLRYGNNSVTMTAPSTPGTWTAQYDNPGNATITNPASATTTITNFTDGGTYKFIWTNVDASDTVEVVITAPDAGIDFSTCSGSVATLTGNYTSGTWTTQAGNPAGASLGSTTNGVASVTFSNPVSGNYYFIYTVNSCPDTVMLAVPANPWAGNISHNMTDCADENGYIAQLNAVNPSPHTGMWTKVSGPGTILSPNDYAASITGITAGATTVVKWLVTTSLGCKDSITQNITAPSIDTSMISKYDQHYCLTCPIRNGNTFTYYDANGKILMQVTDLNDGIDLNNTNVCADLAYNPSGNNHPVSADVRTVTNDQQPYLPRSWAVNPGNSNAAYQASLFFTDEELNALSGRASGTQWSFADVSQLAVTGYPNVNTTYTNPGGATGIYYHPVFERVGQYWKVSITASGANTFYIHPITYPWATLPVELIEFTAKPQETYIRLDWSTVSEWNNDRFEIERSIDALTFMKIGVVKGAGTVKELRYYSYKDEQAASNVKYYYRLKQVDFNGSHKYTQMATAMLFKASGIIISDFKPSPTQGLASVDIMAQENIVIKMTLWNINGENILTKEKSIHKGHNNIEVDFGPLSPGIYLLGFETAEELVLKKVIKSK